MTAEGTTRIEVTLPAPVAEAQAWFEDRARVRRWFGWEAPGLDEGWLTFLHQLRFALAEGSGPGLLVVAQAPGAVPRYLAASATLTTYGLAGDEVESLADRWATWWGSHFAPPTPRPAPSDR